MGSPVQDIGDNYEELPPEKLVEEIQKGNELAETAFYTRYRRGLLMMLEYRTGDSARAEDLAQDTLITVLLKLRSEGIEQPNMLNRYVQQTAKYIFIGWLRKSGNQTELRETVDDVIEEQPSMEDSIWIEKRRQMVRDLIKEMKVARDRELLYRYYVKEQSKPLICDALDLSAAHFDRVINRARNRFKLLISEQFENGF